MTKLLLQSGFALSVIDDGVSFCARKIHKKIVARKCATLYHVYLFDTGEVYGSPLNKRKQAAVECGDNARVGAYDNKVALLDLEEDIREHMKSIGMAEFSSECV